MQSHPKAEIEDMLQHISDVSLRQDVHSIVSGGLTGLMLKQKLAAELSTPVEIDVNLLSTEFAFDHRPMFEYFNRLSAGSLLIMAWEQTRQSHTHDPMWEFLRHCRNAAAHNGVFTFAKREPKRAATWHGTSILPSLEGHILFPDPPARGFIGPGDVLNLLADIEAALL